MKKIDWWEIISSIILLSLGIFTYWIVTRPPEFQPVPVAPLINQVQPARPLVVPCDLNKCDGKG